MNLSENRSDERVDNQPDATGAQPAPTSPTPTSGLPDGLDTDGLDTDGPGTDGPGTDGPGTDGPAEPSAAGTRLLLRFARVPRWVHWTTAVLFGVCMGSAAVLFFGPLSVLVGRRHLVEMVHLYSGYALPVPMLAGWVSAAYRADVRALDRFTAHDWVWLKERATRLRPRLPGRRRSRAGAPASSTGAGSAGIEMVPAGKFNAGQKLYAAFVAGTVIVMLSTGLVMEWGGGLPLAWRTGATFVHDWLAFAVVAAVAGHLWMATRDPVALAGMRTGNVPAAWAEREHPAWTACAPELPPQRDR